MDYSDAIRSIIPGTFAPDIAGAGDKPKITPLGDAVTAGQAAAGDAATSFKDTVKQLLSDVNDKMQTADQNTRDLADGKTNDLNKVVTSVEEANLAFSFAMSMRTKLLDAYQEVSRMQV